MSSNRRYDAKRDLGGCRNPNWRDAGWQQCQQCTTWFKCYNKRNYCCKACYSDSRRKCPPPSGPIGQPLKPVHLASVKTLMRRKLYDKQRPPFILLCEKCCVKKPRTKASKYCAECSNRRQPIPCVICTLPCKVGRKTCSQECRTRQRVVSQLGDKSHRWQGGKTPETLRLRGSQRASDWRKAVFARDDYTCTGCKQRGGRLQADHIKPWSLFPDLRFELSNGRTLCKACHLKTDTWGWKAIYRNIPDAR